MLFSIIALEKFAQKSENKATIKVREGGQVCPRITQLTASIFTEEVSHVPRKPIIKT